MWMVLGRKTYQIFRFILEPDPLGWGHRAIGLGASLGLRVHPRNKPENMEGFGPQNIPFFNVYSAAKPVGLGP